MKIALVGYGKMGRAIEEIAVERGHSIVAKLNETPTAESLGTADVAIEFSHPEAAPENISVCLKSKIPTVSGTTGWLFRKKEMDDLAVENGTGFFYASNFSLGVNIFFEVNKKLAALMRNFDEYRPQLEEIHHIHKKDAPSGTAITIAEGIIENNPKFDGWQLGQTKDNALGIFALREDEVPGTHSVFYRSDVDEIELKHTAYDRKGFALGAVIAAEWLLGKSGVFGMRDVLGIV
ncbi:4-hydroxy-tetrahydrodipicolinate reductase [Cruoricaptor ignavus]|uniref:4-hydroxy-tetrahydrodipicolinate reductase n=1 Tax=Cruoricaptor ignavus TaxID=1118202 RepID=A0A7M1T2Z2_9FLAO|nr:4-hydroxy-tetrahydrodipicolinate reductase [Cruoricaptor ignavus]QOR74236.1 4-hydroxy-tetrahydrodipicolinate reductase [Cruoricaptor ignavus]